MEKLKDAKWRSKILNIISTINIIVLFIIAASDSLLGISFINIFILFLIEYILIPLNDDIEETSLKDKNTLIKLLVKSILLLAFVIAYYRIFSTKNYNLKYTYYTAFISIIIIAVTLYIRRASKTYKKRKSEGKEYNNLYLNFSIIFNLFLAFIIPYTIIEGAYNPYREINLQTIKEPDSISVYKASKDSYRAGMYFDFLSEGIEINSSKDITKILNGIEDEKIETLSITENFNYEKMQKDYTDQYRIWFDYGEVEGKKRKLENGYIQNIRITSNGKAFIEEGNFKKGLIYRENYYNDNFQIELSKDTIDMIRSYIK